MDSERTLSHDEYVRYARHLTLPEVGVAGQERLKAARVLIVGAGGLGSPAALYLAAAGVGTIGLVDADRVDLTNLQRQVLHGTSGVGRSKLESATQRISDLNPHVAVEPFEVRLTSDNALEIIRGFDVVIDGSDNFPTRYLVNDACVLLKRPNVYGAIFRFEGQASLFDAAHGPCYRCLYADPPPPGLVPSCAEGGVLGVLPGIIGSIQALETIKYLLNLGTSLRGRLVLFDALSFGFRELALKKDPQCPVCGANPTIRELLDYEAFCGLGRASPDGREIDVHRLRHEMSDGRDVFLLDVREPHEWQICRLPGAHLMPLGHLPARVAELPTGQRIVAYCHTGVRSLMALRMLKGAGFSDVVSLAGGIEAWAREIDPEMARY